MANKLKKVKTYKRWKIYVDKNETYYCYLPDESPQDFCSAEWEGGSLQEIIDFINSY